jgi:hypothetical protein
MGLPRLSRLCSLRTESTAPAIEDNASSSFRFLSLPKDIRLIVYEQMGMTTHRDKLLLQDDQHYLTFVTTVIPGITILATSRQIKSEASSIILPRLRKILSSPPTIVVRAEHLIGLIDLHDCFGSIYGTTLIQRLVACLHDPRTVQRIMRYRKQQLSARQLWKRLRLQELITIDDEASLKAFARFILRAAKYLMTNTNTQFLYPPLILVIEVPDTFQGVPVTTSTSLMKSLLYKFLSPVFRTPPRTFTGHADTLWLLRRFTFNISSSCELWRVVSFTVKLRALEIGHTGWRLGGRSVQRAIERGLEEARSKKPDVVHYVGRASRRIDEI